MDGVFDIIHSGHFNALRQGKKLGDILVLGINSDEDVEKAKGPTLMNVHERAALVGACKWVDEVVIGTPYTPTIQLLDELNIDYCVHGDDPCFNERGEDVYSEMKKKGRYKVFKRTEGISTTEIIGRLLMLPKDNKNLGQ
jgi:ethanolamine-phosphate cytidylyltransferase